MSIEPLDWGRGSQSAAVAQPRQTGPLPSAPAWSASARSGTLEAAVAALTRANSLGVVITGGRGVGKSSLARAAVTELGPETYSLQLRSSPLGPETPYGCLSFLLARLPQAYLGSPTAVLRGITALIRSDAAGRPCVITLDATARIDDLSAGVLLNVLLTGTAKVVAVSSCTSDLPVDFHWLLTERKLTEVRLENLNEAQTRQVLLSLLGHRVSAPLVNTYHRLVGGNPLLLKALVAEQQHVGNLVLSDAVWTLRDKVVLAGAASLDDIVRSRWARETAQAKDVIELLACARRIELHRLTALYGTETIADMEDDGLLEVEGSDRRWVSLRERYIGEVVRTWLSISRRRELRTVLLAGHEPDPTAMSAPELLDFAAWTNECETDLGPALALAAAGAAVQLFDPRAALAYADMLPRTDSRWIPAQRWKADAYLQLDLPLQALAALEAITERELASLEEEEYSRVIAARAAVMLWIPEKIQAVPAILATAKKRLAAASQGATWPQSDAVAANRLALVDFEYHAFVGDYTAIIPDLEKAADPALNPDTVFRLRAAIILMTALAFTGREMDALHLMRRLGSQLNDSSESVGLRERFTKDAFLLLLMAGQWRWCIDILGTAAVGDSTRKSELDAAHELAIGTAYAFSGRGTEALEPLISAVAQLEIHSLQGALRGAYAATSLAYAQTGNASLAKKYLAKYQSSRGRASFALESVITFCAHTAGRWLGDADAAVVLKETARQHFGAGRYTLAGLFQLAGTVNGSDADYKFLEEIAGYRQGPLAEVSRLIAVGTRTGDAGILLAGGDIAASLELEALEARCMALAVDFARQSGDAATARNAQARLDILATTVASLPIIPTSGSPLLTNRERQIARLAGRGASNRDIALEMGVSVRTVEGHLYQVFTKLGVTSRGDLTGLV
ncbi:Putative HTH-type transcriptional regulator/MT0914 [Arthrobacter ulcerisalmonis]|uniref:HTH-type transcriptional regulator/MT0914 n=1 Tax=Arthrobacter ulcerisalmonis TaxID=2483813 RepID=A0A3P5XA75_9MICC|nr:LuxR C-terminal-related transcriptional regulator [Arthrobacter ulcerisalmonis]VDC27751.1 Putative HTH-type transcriptional regulator/MT0914 [Arthrobacter ulcerisalmonis]